MEGQVCNCWWNKRCLITLWAPPRSHEDHQIEKLARQVAVGNGGTLRLFSAAVLHDLMRRYRGTRGPKVPSLPRLVAYARKRLLNAGGDPAERQSENAYAGIRLLEVQSWRS
jgi:hypothetical protein